MTNAGKTKLVELEGLCYEVYKDSAGLPTIGIGHLLTKSELLSGKLHIGEACVDYRHGITADQAAQLADIDLSPCIETIQKSVTVPLKPNQFDAICLFVYNVGVSAFEHSTLLKVLNSGKFEQVPAQLKRWIYADGKKVQGLINRRNAEIDLFLAT